jgi:hypothetical protein
MKQIGNKRNRITDAHRAWIEGLVIVSYRKSLIHECVTGQRRITEADVARAANSSAVAVNSGAHGA